MDSISEEYGADQAVPGPAPVRAGGQRARPG